MKQGGKPKRKTWPKKSTLYTPPPDGVPEVEDEVLRRYFREQSREMKEKAPKMPRLLK